MFNFDDENILRIIQIRIFFFIGYIYKEFIYLKKNNVSLTYLYQYYQKYGTSFGHSEVMCKQTILQLPIGDYSRQLYLSNYTLLAVTVTI
jgi:hypothetical protein